MKISIRRGDELVAYELKDTDTTLLKILDEIKENMDNTLTYNSGCKSSVCGSCAMRVNSKEVLACSHKIKDGDVVEPLKNLEVIRDLVVDMDKAYAFNKKAKTWQSKQRFGVMLTHEDEKANEVQSDCILCASCFSACPVYAVNGEFLGPFSLTRVWRYVSDKREDDEKSKIDNIQTNGVWDCTLCNECSLVCPQGISSKADIEKLRMKSAQYGYMDPNFSSFGGFDGGLTF
jgi:fumarate reductase iron-sulfur subunit